MLVKLRHSCSAATARSVLVLGVTLKDIPMSSQAHNFCIASREIYYNVKHDQWSSPP